MKKFQKNRKNDWLQLKKYYLRFTAAAVEPSPLKIKQNLKVTFNESPEIRRIGEEQRDKAGSRAEKTTHDSSKSDRISAVKN
jgi:hypothetical protein